MVYVDGMRFEQLRSGYAPSVGGEWILLRSEQRLKLALTEKAKESGTPGMSRKYPVLTMVARNLPNGSTVISAAILGLSILACSLALHASQNPASSNNPPGLNQQSTVRDLIERGEFSQAQDLLSQQILRGSDLFSAYFWLGNLELRRGRTFASIRAYRQAEALQPQNGEIHRLLASDYFLLNQRKLFKEEIQEALAVNPDDQQAYYLAGRFAYEVETNYAVAVDDLSKASRLNPADSKAHYYLALSYGRLNRPDEAQREFVRACESVESEKYTAPFRGLAEILLEKGNAASALQYLERALRIDPDDAESHYLEAKAFLQLGQTEEAIAALKRSVSLDPSYAEPEYLLGITYAKHGQQALAQQAMARFRQIQEEYGRD
jgi:tetratricopeptide (TPR) repeat protein